MGTFDTFNHTADLGLSVRGTDLADLLETAARGLFAVMLVDRPPRVEEEREVRASAPPGDREELLVAWLQELLYLFETAHLVPLEFAFDPPGEGEGEVRARVGFGRFDPAGDRAACAVKGVTYHGLRVCRVDDGTWSARLVLDV